MEEKSADQKDLKSNYTKISNVPFHAIFEAKQDQNPRVTIAIPTYRRPILLREALESAIHQRGFNNYDIIIVDNDPERNCATEQMMLYYRDSNVSYYKNSENLGMTGNWNRLFTIAKGEYVVMLHDDDLLFPDYLAAIFGFIDNHKGKFIATFPNKVCLNLDKPGTLTFKPKRSFIYGFTINVKDFLWGNILGAPVGMCIEKEAAIKAGGFNPDYYPSSDYEFYVNLASYTKLSKLGGRPLCIYRTADSNESKNAITTRGFILQDARIKHNILAKYNHRWLKLLWGKYSNVYTFKYLEGVNDRFKNTELITAIDLKQMGFHFNWLDKIIYLILNVVKYVIFRLRMLSSFLTLRYSRIKI